jgi:hypothetical protein
MLRPENAANFSGVDAARVEADQQVGPPARLWQLSRINAAVAAS